MSSIVKVVEIIAQSTQSFDDAATQAVKEVASTVRRVRPGRGDGPLPVGSGPS